MRSVIVYYSYSGNTKQVAGMLSEYLRQKGEVVQIELKALDETNSFLGQCRRAFFKAKAQLAPVNYDLSAFDLVCFGTPVWAFGPAPAMNAYLDHCFGVENKKIILFTTYGSGTGNQRCLSHMQGILSKKSVGSVRRFSIQQFKVQDREYVFAKIKEIQA